MWVKVSDNAVVEAQFTRLPRSTRLFYVELVSWSNRAEADGHIPFKQVRLISDEPDPMGSLELLLAAGAMVGEPAQLGYRLVWWLADQPTKEQVERERTAGRERAAKSRDRKRLHGLGDHSECPRTYTCRQGSGNVVLSGRKGSQGSAEREQGNGRTLSGGRAHAVQGSPDPSRPDPFSPYGDGEGGRASPPPSPERAPAPPVVLELKRRSPEELREQKRFEHGLKLRTGTDNQKRWAKEALAEMDREDALNRAHNEQEATR